MKKRKKQNEKRTTITLFVIATIAAFAITATPPVHAEEITLLHEFTGGVEDGGAPSGGSLTLNSGKLYGLTETTAFSVETDGSNFNRLHRFDASTEGRLPYGSLVLSSETLYGTNPYYGPHGYGTVFSLGTDGSNFTVVHDFAGGTDDGRAPHDSLLLNAGKLYGTTQYGGAVDYGYGVIFSMETDGNNFSLVHTFAGGVNGCIPKGSLILDSGKFYGTTQYGGTSNMGTLFSVGIDGNDFNILHNFGWTAGGRLPSTTLIVDPVTQILYGMAGRGGSSNLGTIFSISTDGSNFTVLHDFAGGNDDGQSPNKYLILDSGKLYGMTSAGGDSNLGTVFSMGMDGSGFSLLHEFAGGGNDGSTPMGSLTLDSGKLYGMTRNGGDFDYGTVFFIHSAPHILDQIGIGGNYFDRNYTVEQKDQLYDAYFAADQGDTFVLDGDDITWSYLGNESPIWDGHEMGDAFWYEGKRYIMLGSGLEGTGGAIPELPAGAIPFLGVILSFGFVRRKTRRA
ncbi:MAG: choice-of-anchor tandem repeat GloVer-containing protein [Candidatus Omnitrophota bacterium]